MVTKPISAEQVIPKARAVVFIAERTRHAPVPQASIIIPTRPTNDARSLKRAFTATTLSL